MGDDILDFDEQIAEEFTANAPVPFRFHGEIFKAHGDGPGLVLLEFVKAAVAEDGLATADAMLDFLEACMPSDEFARFRAVCNDPAIVTPVDHLGVVVRGLLGRYNDPDRPTVPSSSSSDGSSPTGTGSTDGGVGAATASTD